MSIALKPRTPLKLPEENPLISALKKRLLEFRGELANLWSHFDSRFRAEKERIDAKLREADRILEDVKKVKDGHTPTEEELTELIERYIPEVEDGHTPTEEELTTLILKHMPELKDGKTPTENELLALIRPLVPEVQNGHTPTDRELLKLIKPLIPSPIKGEKGKDGTEIRPEEIKSKLKELPVKEAWFSVDHILGLTDKIRNLVRGFQGVGKLGGGQGAPWTFESLSGAVDNSNTTFTLSQDFTNAVIFLNGQLLRLTDDYTRSGTTITTTFTPTSGSMYAWCQT